MSKDDLIIEIRELKYRVENLEKMCNLQEEYIKTLKELLDLHGIDIEKEPNED